MARPKDSDEGSKLPQRRRNIRRTRAHDEPLSEPRNSDEGGVPPQRNGGGDRREAHIEYLARKLGGGALPTPQAYARAAKQWQHLPGAVGNVPAPNLTPAQAASEPTDKNAAPPTGDVRGQGERP